MSSIPGHTLEDFVEDCLLHPTPREVARIVALLEPRREEIENALWDYDEETMSWRDYRNSLAETYLADDVDDAADWSRAR